MKMESHIKIIAILHIIFGSITVLAGLAVLVFFGGLASVIGGNAHDSDALVAIPIIGGIGSIICIVLLVMGLPGIIAGIGMLQFRSWGRILGIVISALDLISFPFGTALGIYGLWALLSREGELLFLNPPQRQVRAY